MLIRLVDLCRRWHFLFKDRFLDEIDQIVGLGLRLSCDLTTSSEDFWRLLFQIGR